MQRVQTKITLASTYASRLCYYLLYNCNFWNGDIRIQAESMEPQSSILLSMTERISMLFNKITVYLADLTSAAINITIKDVTIRETGQRCKEHFKNLGNSKYILN